MSYIDILQVSDQLLSLLGAFVIVFAAVRTTYSLLRDMMTKTIDIGRLRLELGYGIILGLEFMIGADIIESMIHPTYHDIGILVALVFVRTFLSYFLGKELKEVQASLQ